jgi:hypothetical protein
MGGRPELSRIDSVEQPPWPSLRELARRALKLLPGEGADATLADR